MGLFDKGIKTDVSEKQRNEIDELLIAGETIEGIYPLIIDFLCITNKRVIFVDKILSIKDPKTFIYSVPFKNIISVGLEKNEKVFAFTDGLSLITVGQIFHLKLFKGTNVLEVYKNLVGKII